MARTGSDKREPRDLLSRSTDSMIGRQHTTLARSRPLLKLHDNWFTELRRALAQRIQGEVRFDDGSRALYATDASNYRHMPIGVVVPRTVHDGVTAIAISQEAHAPWRALLLAAAGCAGEQSSLEPAGPVASRIATLFWGMTIASAIIWIAVMGLALYATYFARAPLDRAKGRKLIVGGGVLFPIVVLSALLAIGLTPLPHLLSAAPPGTLRVHVTGLQWWWHVEYQTDGGPTTVLANEIRLPAGRPVEFRLEARDVIHSFWIPALGGKTDMIPGRRTRLLLTPSRPGTYRGACAEFCGASHARMTFVVVVEDPLQFDQWLAAQAEPARPPLEPVAVRGAELFGETGCGACHTVRGTEADGMIGPDLTHVGSRLTIAAGTLPRDPDAFLRFISQTDAVKPGVHMPAFGMLPPDDLRALAAYLEGLK